MTIAHTTPVNICICYSKELYILYALKSVWESINIYAFGSFMMSKPYNFSYSPIRGFHFTLCPFIFGYMWW